MNTKQTIAIIGATGNMGSALSRSLAKGNYRLLLKANNSNALNDLVLGIKNEHSTADVEAAECATDAGWEADIIILAVPFAAEAAIAEKIKEVANQKIVVSISNPLNERFDGLSTAPGTSSAEILQAQLPNSKVVKAFNTSFAANFSASVFNGIKTDAFIAGDDEDALKIVSELVETVGFNPVIAGKLSVSNTLEQMQLLLIQLGMKYNYNWHAGWKILTN
ncbi:MAG: NADP oxidoreductase [Chitinophagaceae bacterium]|nr:MAG: NADP oxidoreductase [Chitinophagaceae bacterium]